MYEPDETLKKKFEETDRKFEAAFVEMDKAFDEAKNRMKAGRPGIPVVVTVTRFAPSDWPGRLKAFRMFMKCAFGVLFFGKTEFRFRRDPK